MTRNRLAAEASPYLLQHAGNPVDWYPWGEEALERARAEDKPILLSVGYAACHWCHVMERESFEDAETAAIMNERFVNVKVDREERPDIDAVYMNAVQAMTGHGGWPMTVFLTPGGEPFYGGTYFPPDDRHGLPSFRRVLGAVHDAWTSRRHEVERQGKQIAEHIERASAIAPSREPLGDEVLSTALRALGRDFDREWGGFGGAPKFPQAAGLEFLLRMHARGAPDAAGMLTTTLDRMARGGIFDQVGGGFHRYAVDRVWLVPHFEKMLYDNAQLLRLYTRAWLAMREPLYRDVAIATGEYLLREMRDPRGGFWSSQDADSEGVEGRFYVWSQADFEAACGPDAAHAAAAFGVVPGGNWEGTNVLWRPHDDDAVAQAAGAKPEQVREAVARARGALAAARGGRVRPATDDKVLAGWNGLAISGLAEAGRALGRPDFVGAATHAADFVWTQMRRADGRLTRAWRDGRSSGPAFSDDYAMLAAACLDLYETTFDPRWYERADALARALTTLFADERGGFFDTGSDAPAPVVRPKSVFDNAVPSGNSVGADVLLRLAALSGDAELERAGAAALRSVGEVLSRAPHGFGAALGALDLYVTRATEIAISGDPDSEDARALLDVVFGGYAPNRVIAAGVPGTERPELLRGKTAQGGATAYVCKDFVCDRPVTSPHDLAAALGRSHP